MSRLVKLVVQPKGRKLPITEVGYLRLHQDLHAHHSFELSVPFDYLEGSLGSFMQTAHQELVGKPISLLLQEEATGASTDFAFTGIVTDLVLGNDNDYTGSFLIKGYSPTCLMTDGIQKRTFLNKSLSAIVDQVMQPYPADLLTKTNAPASSKPLPYVVQYNESAFDFLNRLAAECHEWFYYDGTRLQIGRPKEDKTVKLNLDGYWSNFQLSATIRPPKVSLYSYEAPQHKHFRGQGEEQVAGIGTNQYAQFALQTSHEVFTQTSYVAPGLGARSQSELDEANRNMTRAQATSSLTFQGRSEDPNLRLGTIIDVSAEGLGSANTMLDSLGKYRIVSLEHVVDQAGNYHNTFTAILHSLELPPLNPHVLSPAAQPELAEVINLQDPERLGRIKVRYYWPTEQPQQAETDWIRVSTPYSGDGKGQLFTPEVGSQVLIGYALNRAETPLVLGNLFHPQNKQSAKYTNPQNSLKGLQTAGGNKFVMTDTAGQQKILISNSNNKGTALEVGFNGDGSISLKTNGPISLTAGGDITLTAQKDITLTAGNNITITAKKNVVVTAQEAAVALDAKQALDLVAENLTADFRNNLTINASAQAKIRSQDTDII
ncbi:type VI secretion system Vgr family protein [Hymenobacter cavernae]|uniref:Gp5/Type VI secretion system Vgr protein OB-fold domain-containing protein n=1 Tax=Hymenobacter cavernae TaxID=2044852 RepID=A0ABQ1UUA0_9BACT|nr:contractile injection system protein, VgrG/Pvc8 family [Hymenobacter cavernae]GGF26718.1 hypothetical protein GCM10011383_42810 [Hymenobacter cavernae]